MSLFFLSLLFSLFFQQLLSRFSEHAQNILLYFFKDTSEYLFRAVSDSVFVFDLPKNTLWPAVSEVSGNTRALHDDGSRCVCEVRARVCARA
jgi:hypothetical protein